MWDGCVTWCEGELCAWPVGRREHLGPLLVTSGDLWALSQGAPVGPEPGTIIHSTAQTFRPWHGHWDWGTLGCIYSFVYLKTYWFEVGVLMFFLQRVVWLSPQKQVLSLLAHKIAAEVLCNLKVVQSERYAAFNSEFLTGSILIGHDV